MRARWYFPPEHPARDILQIEVAEQEVFFVMFQLVILQEDTLSLDFFGQIADRFVVREGFALDANQLYRQPVGQPHFFGAEYLFDGEELFALCLALLLNSGAKGEFSGICFLVELVGIFELVGQLSKIFGSISTTIINIAVILGRISGDGAEDTDFFHAITLLKLCFMAAQHAECLISLHGLVGNFEIRGHTEFLYHGVNELFPHQHFSNHELSRIFAHRSSHETNLFVFHLNLFAR